MQVIRDSSSVPAEIQGCVVALGNFDGLHLGHRAVLDVARTHAKDTNKPFTVVTFEPHPRRIFRPDLPLLRIMPLHEKIQMLGKSGVDYLRIIRFTRKFAQTSAQDFIQHYMLEQLGASHIVTGDDFIFGHNREGNIATLKQYAALQGVTTTACPQVKQEGQRCSSTRIRELLVQGKVEQAAELLGRPYHIAGQVQQGDKRGRTLGFPTANLFPPPIFLPKFGVYAVRTHFHGKSVTGMANLGTRPTFNGARVRLEVHLFDWQGDIYGQHLDVELAHFIRPEQTFESVEALKAQIAQDGIKARELIA